MNKIGDSGASQIANSLQRNFTLTNLNLSSNNIGISGASLLANSLRHNITLKFLHLLGNNNISGALLSKVESLLSNNIKWNKIEFWPKTHKKLPNTVQNSIMMMLIVISKSCPYLPKELHILMVKKLIHIHVDMLQ